ncbi:hypothetical protein LJB95_01020 [Paludibacteraceae bacterium OttesenSCG-928-F17]|nr:hypothetical protein [Paludibacteraceae bacterium OttesenSCG-928-F17]
MKNLDVNLYTEYDQPYMDDIGSGGNTTAAAPIKVNVRWNTIIQSPYTTLLAAGSTGEDGSVEGIHLRWLFNKELGENHLPKGDWTNQSHNFNKRNDFVRILRAECNSEKETICPKLESASKIDNYNALWIYNTKKEKKIHLYFLDKYLYSMLNNSSEGFSIANYFKAGGIIEVTSESDLFFNVELIVESSGPCQLETEMLSEMRSNTSSIRRTVISSRKKEEHTSNLLNFNVENGRGFRIKTNSKDLYLLQLSFEFYTDIIPHANDNNLWEEIGKFSLETEDDTKVYQRLEPQAGTIHGKWPRFTKGTGVNIQSYKNRWTSGASANNLNEWGIKEVVTKYLEESESANNPTALINYPEEPYKGEKPEQPVEKAPEEEVKISLLQLINFGAMDFHIARMLGLGTIDSSVQARDGSKYIYLLEYYSQGDLNNGRGNIETHHLYFSAPTSKYDQRLPLPVKIKEIKPGIEFEDNASDDNGMNLVGNNGYSVDGRLRYVTLKAESEVDPEDTKANFQSGAQFDLNNSTFPVYAGVRYKLQKKGITPPPYRVD